MKSKTKSTILFPILLLRFLLLFLLLLLLLLFLLFFLLSLGLLLLVISFQFLKERVGILLGVEPQLTRHLTFIHNFLGKFILTVIQQQVLLFHFTFSNQFVLVHHFDFDFFQGFGAPESQMFVFPDRLISCSIFAFFGL